MFKKGQLYKQKKQKRKSFGEYVNYFPPQKFSWEEVFNILSNSFCPFLLEKIVIAMLPCLILAIICAEFEGSDFQVDVNKVTDFRAILHIVVF